jgi:hypothetical protein
MPGDKSQAPCYLLPVGIARWSRAACTWLLHNRAGWSLLIPSHLRAKVAQAERGRSHCCERIAFLWGKPLFGMDEV